MKKAISFGLLLAAVAAGADPVAENPNPALDNAPPEITVRFYNYAGASKGIIASAHQEASRILVQAGVRLTWLSCTPDSEGLVADHCNQVNGPQAVTLMLCPKKMAPREGLPRGIFGFSLMASPGRFATSARIYLHRLSEVADGRNLRRGILLGSMMAHELGHLLLGVNSHSKKGIMSIPWGPKTLQQADRGRLGFTAQQAAAIQAQARLRHASRRKT